MRADLLLDGHGWRQRLRLAGHQVGPYRRATHSPQPGKAEGMARSANGCVAIRAMATHPTRRMSFFEQSRSLPNPRLFRQTTLRVEAQSTAALEGTYEPLARVLGAADDAEKDPSLREVSSTTWPSPKPPSSGRRSGVRCRYRC